VTLAQRDLRSPVGKQALSYLTTERGFTDEVIDRFGVGFCPLNSPHQLCGRIITPIYDTFGELVALSTRHIDRNHSLRFWHETFDKGSYLYGLHLAKDEILRTGKVIIVEGEFDVIAYHSRGFKMTVGLCGKAFTLFQIGLLSRYCSEFYLMLDGDVSGRSALKRMMEMFDKEGLAAYGLRFVPVYLPKDVDPDEFLYSAGSQGVREKLIQSRDDETI
jgi:DNA primase